MSAITDERKSAAPKTSPQDLALEILRSELSRRIAKNPQYSLRALAKTLGVSHTLLSLVINGRRKPSKKMIEKMIERLDLTAAQSSRLLRSSSDKRSWRVLPGAKKITLDEFALISEWQHYAILSLLEVPDTQFDEKFISQRLGISVLLAKVSMQRLVEMGIVEKAPDGRWRQRTGPIVVENTSSTDSTRKFNRQLIQKALESLDNDPIEIRDFSSTTFAMSPTQVPYALQRIREFRRELVADLEAQAQPEEVYHLTVQIFPTSKRSKI